MNDRAEIERLLQMTGRTLEGLPSQKGYFNSIDFGQKRENAKEMMERSGFTHNDVFLLHQSYVIELLVGALRDALEKPMQKPLTLTEANAYQEPLWIEFRDFKEANGWRDGLCDALNWAHRVYKDLKREAEFMVHYRLWRHKPTDEERRAAVWLTLLTAERRRRLSAE